MKRDPRLRGLSEDHHHALFLARKIRLALEAGEGKHAEELTASGWTEELAPHLEAEEEVLVPAMQAAGMHVLAARILTDHAALSDARARGLAGDAEQLARFAEVLVEHVRFEERVVFPAVEEGLSNEALAAVSARTPWGRR
ncbi:MAG: hemerythrin domain-containing protein [Myxococcota bacterium]